MTKVLFQLETIFLSKLTLIVVDKIISLLSGKTCELKSTNVHLITKGLQLF